MLKQKMRLSGKKVWIIIAVIALLASGAAALFTWQTRARNVLQTSAASPYKTVTVTRGDIAISASGSGTLVAGSVADLSFPVSGTVLKVNVAVGDKVTAGEELAVLGGTDALELDVQTRQLAVNAAKKALAELQNNGTLTLAQAEIDLATAQAAYADAQKNLHNTGDERCNDKLTTTYWYQYLEAQKVVDVWETELNSDSKYGRDYILEHLYPAQKQRNTAYGNWSWCDSYTDQEVLEAHATLDLAKATMDQAAATVEKLKASSGIDQVAMQVAELKVANAERQLALAQKTLDSVVLMAPFDGTVTALAGSTGSLATTATFITVSDLANPSMTVYLDETDMQNIAVGCTTSTVFDSLPNKAFTGTVSEVSPQLSAGNGYSAVQAKVKLDPFTLSEGQTLPLGLSASVEVVCGQSNNTLMMPVEALHTLNDGSYAVYVLTAAGTAEERSVTIGLNDSTDVEIISGLNEGELAITSGPGL
jgi:HlyD family secretion protein